MGKDEDERDKTQHAKDRIDEYAAKQGEEHICHRQEGQSNLVDATMVIENQTVLEDKDVHKSEVLSGKPFEEGRGSASTSSKTAWADDEFENEEKEMAAPNDDREELELEDASAHKPDARFMTPERHTPVCRQSGEVDRVDPSKTRKVNDENMETNDDTGGMNLDSVNAPGDVHVVRGPEFARTNGSALREKTSEVPVNLDSLNTEAL